MTPAQREAVEELDRACNRCTHSVIGNDFHVDIHIESATAIRSLIDEQESELVDLRAAKSEVHP